MLDENLDIMTRKVNDDEKDIVEKDRIIEKL